MIAPIATSLESAPLEFGELIEIPGPDRHIPENAKLLTAEQCAEICGFPNAQSWRHHCKKDARLPQPVQWPTPESKGQRWYRAEVEAYVSSLVQRRRQAV